MVPAHLGRVSYPAWRRLPRARPAARQTRAWRQVGDDAPASPRTAVEADPLLFAEQDTGALVVGERARGLGLDVLTPIVWHKIANGVTEAQGNGAGFYGKPYQPGAIVKNDIEYILFLRKGGRYRKVTSLQKALSMLTGEELQEWWRSIWADIRGTSTRRSHPAPYPTKLAERLIRMFSFAGDTVLDPFAGTGSTAVAAIAAGRHSVSVEIDPGYVRMAGDNIRKAVRQRRAAGAVHAELEYSDETQPRHVRGGR